MVAMTTIFRAFLLGVLASAFWASQVLFASTIDAAVLPIEVLGAERTASAVFFTFELALAAMAISAVVLGATVRRES